MKRTFIVLALIAAVGLIATSCATAPGAAPAQQPAPVAAPVTDPVSDFISGVRRNAPENAMLGIGTSNHTNRAMARSTAEARGRAEITRQLNVVVSNMVIDYMAGSEADQAALLSFQESITQTLAHSLLRGATVRDEINVNGEQVTVVMLSSANVANEIMEANRAAAALAPHMANAQWALERMGRALEAQNMAPPVLRDHD